MKMTPVSLLTQTRLWLKKHHIRVSKRLGQHFLVDETILEHIIQYANLSNSDQVLEIGTGNGVLTRALANHAQRVFTIEHDSHLFEILTEELAPNPKITLIFGDAVKIAWPPCDRLVANLPYSISSPVLFRFYSSEIPTAVLMLQKEFADRLGAQPGSKQYGRLSVMTAYHASVETLEDVSPNSFFPPPKVASAIVHVQRRTHPPFSVVSPKLFSQLTTALFNQRRKKIRTPLQSFLGKPTFVQLQARLAWLDYRVEELSPGQIAELSNNIHEALGE
jgi:16S rRNA (adenine1518-N6/adenine1519-N6)-dimethyltransferase